MKASIRERLREKSLVLPFCTLLILAFSVVAANATIWSTVPDWKDGKRDLKVYISNNGSFEPVVEDAMNKWNTANSGNDWNFTKEQNESDADISIDQEEPPAGYNGWTTLSSSGGRLKSGHIKIKPSLTGNQQLAVILHELGHCMRLTHTSNANDVMRDPGVTATTPSANDAAEAEASDEDPPCPFAAARNALRGQLTIVPLIAKPGSNINLVDVLDVEISSLTGPEISVESESILWDSSGITATFEVSNLADHNEVFNVHLVYPAYSAYYAGVLTITDDNLPPGMFPHAVAGSDTTVDGGTPVILDGRNSYHDEPSVFFSGMWTIDNSLSILHIYGELTLSPGEHIAVLEVMDYYGRMSQDTVLVTVTGDIPTLTEWGLIIFGLVLLGFITWVFLRRRKAIAVRV